MGATDIPVTSAVRTLRAAKVDFTPRLYPYVEHGGTGQVAKTLGVDEHTVVKTLVMESHAGDGRPKPLIVLMHGDCEVSTKQLARALDVKSVAPASEDVVKKTTGYAPGGVSPFGTRSRLPVYVEETILDLDLICINGGKRGFLVEIHPAALTSLLAATLVRVGI